MVSKAFAVEIYVGRGVCAAKLQIVTVRGGKLFPFQRLRVQARAAEIIVSAVLSVDGIPAMRKIDRFSLAHGNIGRVLYKQPILVQIQYVSHNKLS
jgi:hypothetical protein